MKFENIFYFHKLNEIGGVESFFYYLAKKYNNMTIIYDEASDLQIRRLSQLVELRKYRGEKIICKKAFFNYNPTIINNVEADEYIEVVHCVYSELEDIPKPIIHNKFTKYIGVSKVACDSFTELTGLPCECMYIPVEVDKPKKTFIFVSATRLTDEKGRDNMIMFGDICNIFGLSYIWFVFTDSEETIDNPNIVWMKPTMEITNYLSIADFVIQLSKTESFCLTVNESLLLGTPVIVTDLPVYKELGIKDGIHGYIVEDGFKEFDASKLFNKLPKINYTIPKSDWDKYLDNNGTYNPNKIVKVKPIAEYIDIEEHERKIPGKSKPFKVKYYRACYLMDLGYVELC